MSKPAKQKYRTKNWPAYTKALRARGSLTMWLDRDMAWQAAPVSGRPGRPMTYSDAAVQCCLTMKVLFGLALRQTQGFVQSVLELSGLDWQAPDYSTMSRREKRLTVEIKARPSWGGVPQAVAQGSPGDRRRDAGDPGDRGDGQRRGGRADAAGAAGTDPGRGGGAVGERGAEAVIPTRKNAQPWKAKRPGAAARNETLRATNRLGRAIWKKWSGYHRRSLVETKMRCFTHLGTPVTQAVA